MSEQFAETLKKLRTEKGMTQRDLAEQLFVSRTSVNRWENGSRLPDAAMIVKLAELFDVDIEFLFKVATESDFHPNIIMIDDNKIILTGGMQVLKEVLPTATVSGFTKPLEALEFARHNHVELAFIDIEMGSVSGFDVVNKLLQISPRTNAVYLTAYPSYALNAWETDACGFMVKPITAEGVEKQLKKLRYPFIPGGSGV